MAFTTPLVLEHDGGCHWVLWLTLRYQSPLGDVFEVPKGFATDLASIPRILWPLMPPCGPWARAAVLHDFVYREGPLSRLDCDRLFRTALADSGVPWFTRSLMYRAVRLGGRSSYKG